MDIYLYGFSHPIAVSVKFQQEDYTFGENVEQAVVGLVRTGGTAGMFTVTIMSGKKLCKQSCLIIKVNYQKWCF